MNTDKILSRADIQLVVQLALSALSRSDLRACVIGSVAAVIHGMMYREPKVCVYSRTTLQFRTFSICKQDVDLLVLNAENGQDAEAIKRIVVEMDASHFSLTPSRIAGATHRLLWCTMIEEHNGTAKISNTNPTTRTCKVDILTPNQLYMTRIPELQLYRDSEHTFEGYFLGSQSQLHVPISYVPFSTLLMLKLRAWVDHLHPSANEVKHGKIPQYEDDVQELLEIGMRDGKLDCINHHCLPEDDLWILGGFSSWREAEQYVGKFMKKWPRTVNGWRALGFF